jgi:hypothetical protein
MKSLKNTLREMFDESANKIAIVFFLLVNTYYLFFMLVFKVQTYEAGFYVVISLTIQLIYLTLGAIFAQVNQNKAIYVASMLYPLALAWFYIPIIWKGL